MSKITNITAVLAFCVSMPFVTLATLKPSDEVIVYDNYSTTTEALYNSEMENLSLLNETDLIGEEIVVTTVTDVTEVSEATIEQTETSEDITVVTDIPESVATETIEETTVVTESTTDTSVQTEVTTEYTGSDVITPLPDMENLSHEYVWVGDSRTVGMSMIMGLDDKEVIAKSGEGLKWLKEQINNITSIKNSTVIFNFGVNDLSNAKKYVEFFNSLPDDFMDNNDVVIMSVNPVDEVKEKKYGYSVTNKSIDEFNKTLESGLSDDFIWLDSNSYLQSNGYGTADGVHYTKATYTDIYNLVVGEDQ